MILVKTNTGRLKLTDETLWRMRSYAQYESDKLEAGGVLLGRLIKDSKDVIVDRVTVPMVGDQRGRHGFVRSEKSHQRVIASAWRKSCGTCHYLGEWHTHPENYPTPSRQDYDNWRNILKNRTFYSFYLYFVIVGLKEIRVWEGNPKSKKIKQLKNYG